MNSESFKSLDPSFNTGPPDQHGTSNRVTTAHETVALLPITFVGLPPVRVAIGGGPDACGG